jgi:ankyrin repeat protein
MTAPDLPLDVLLLIADEMTDDNGEPCFSDLNWFLQVNSTLHDLLNPLLWREAARNPETTKRILRHVIKTRNLGRLKYFLELGVDVETFLPDFKIYCDESPSALIAAAYIDNVPMARLLLEHGARVDYHPPELPRFSAMHAVQSVEMVQLLLEFGADLQKVDESLNTPVHHAARKGYTEVVMLLVDLWPMSVRAENQQRDTPLYWAAISGELEMVKFLLDCWTEGAMANNAHCVTPLHCAAGEGPYEIVRLLLDVWPEGVKARTVALETPLYYAASSGDCEVVRLLVDRWPAGLRETDISGDTVLHEAAYYGKMPVMKLLVDLWPDGKETTNRNGLTPLAALMKAQHWGSLTVTEKEERIALLGY